MISPDHIKTIKSTVPVLQAGGEALTRHFYQRMFEHNPEVVPLFNPANQESGSQQQALAGAICGYAQNIDNLGALTETVELIAQKHASLRIKPEHYPIVGQNLLSSIKEVLGDGATDDVIESWGAAYNFLADILINREKEIYDTQASALGGWQDFKHFSLVDKVVENDIVTSFYLKPADDTKPPSFKPGQYITVRVPSPCGHTTMRNYSLSNKPGQDHFRISVKREAAKTERTPNGFVSHYLHNQLEVGHQIELASPSGDFFIDPNEKNDRPLILLSAGIGVTPIMSILLSALETQRDITLIHASLDEESHTFKNLMNELDEKHSNLNVHYCYSQDSETRELTQNTSTGYVDEQLIKRLVVNLDADYYFCGPKPFMINQHKNLLALEVPRAQINFEFFGPREEIEQA